MKSEILQLAMESLKREMAEMQGDVQGLKLEMLELKAKSLDVVSKENVKELELDKLLSTKEVEKILGVCYNTLQTNIVSKGLLVPKRISARKIRYSKKELKVYMDNLESSNAKSESHG